MSETSIEAFKKVEPHLGLIQLQVLEFIRRERSGCTDYDIEIAFDRGSSTLRTRRSELVKLGLVLDSGRTIKQDGSKRTIWVAA